VPFELAVIVPAFLLIAGLLHIIPVVTRPDLFFAVTVEPAFRAAPDGHRILRRYRAIVWSSALAAIAVDLALGWALAAVLILAAGYSMALVGAHARALAYAVPPNPVREVDLAAPRETLPGGWIVALLPVASLAGLGLWAYSHWDRLPRRLTLHWGLHGADRWVGTTHSAVFGFLAVHALLCLLLIAAAWGVTNWSRRISTSGAAGAGERRFRRRIAQLLIVVEYFLVFPAWFSLFQPPAAAVNVWASVLIAVVVAFSVSLLRAGQGGSRAVVTAGGPPAGDRTPDDCWKLGLFYVNSADPSILVEKRIGIGYTLNLGNRRTWAVLALVLVPLVAWLILR
jgi:uncharacterized membrane protein